MILRLRNRHRFTWMVLALLLPAGFVLSLANRPGPVLPGEERDENSSPSKKGRAFATATTEDWRVTLYQGPDEQAWMEVKFSKASQRPASTLYLAPYAGAGPGRAKIVGPVNPRGIYQYPLDSLTASWPEYHLFFYDQVRKQTYSETQLTKSH